MARTELPPRHPFNPFYPERVIVTPIRKPLRKIAATHPEAAGVSVSAWIVHAAREEAHWAVARQITGELAAEVGVTADDLAWATSVLGVDTDGFCKSVICRHLRHKFG